MNSPKKVLWSEEEDRVLKEYVKEHGRGKWNRIPKLTGLKRSGKSCRLRWLNYLSPVVKRGDFSKDEEDLIVRLHRLIGNRWSLIAGRVPGRTDNQVKNYWNTHLCKRLGSKKQARKDAMPSREQEIHGPVINSKILQNCQVLLSDHPSSFCAGETSSDAQEGNLQGKPETPLFFDLFNWNSPEGLMEFLD